MPLPRVGDVPASIDLPGQDQTVTFDFVDGYVLVHGMVDNSGPYTFVLDTGAGATIISPNIANKLPQDFNGSATIVSSVDPNSINTQFIRVENLSVGSIQFQNFQAAILPEIVIRSPNGQVTIDGIMGLQLFRNLLLTVNYPGTVVRVRQGSLPASNDCLILPVQRSDADLLLLTLDVTGRAVDAVVDTGNNEFLLLPTSFSNLPFDGPTHTGTATTVTGNLTTMVGILNGNVDLGCIEVLKPQVTVAGNVASLGSGLFSQLILSIDQNAGVLQFEQAAQ
jgi:predicted aspartyl protease